MLRYAAEQPHCSATWKRARPQVSLPGVDLSRRIEARPLWAPALAKHIGARIGGEARMPIPAVQLGARSIKIVVVLDAAQVAEALRPFSAAEARIPVVIAVDGRQLRFDLAPKAIRKCLATIAEHGADHVAVLVQGKLLPGDVVGEAGLVAQPKKVAPKPEAAMRLRGRREKVFGPSRAVPLDRNAAKRGVAA